MTETLNQPCVVCASTAGHRLYYPREMMFGTGEVFEYLECGHCGCLQIASVPEDLGRHYPNDGYYSYQPSPVKKHSALIRHLRAERARAYLGHGSLIGKTLAFLAKESEHFQWFRRGAVNLDSRIADIGCGAGKLLLKLQREGFRNLTGVDPFIAGDIDYGNGVTILKRSISELGGSFDFLMLHHSFEHMTDPHSSLQQLRRLVADEGTVLLRIPVADSYARRKYGINWVAWDAPRHLYLHTVKSMHLLAEQNGFRLVEVSYDSTYAQFAGSELYLRGISLPGKAKANFSRAEVGHFSRMAEYLNISRDGDTACFYFTPVT